MRGVAERLLFKNSAAEGSLRPGEAKETKQFEPAVKNKDAEVYDRQQRTSERSKKTPLANVRLRQYQRRMVPDSRSSETENLVRGKRQESRPAEKRK